jgi:hypothetical protein
MKRIALIGIVVALVGGGVALAASSGISRIVLAKGTTGDVRIDAKGPVEVTHRITTWEPKGTTGWASWRGDLLVTVKAGELTYFNASEDDCAPQRLGVGKSFVIRAGSVYQAMNRGSETAEVHWVALLPPGSGVKEEAKPAGCPG